MKKCRLLSKTIFVSLFATAMSLASCVPTGDDENSPNGGGNGGGSDPDEPEIVDPNPKELNILGLVVNIPQINLGNIKYTWDGMLTSDGDWRFVNLEKIDNIADIKTIPWRTWVESVYAKTGYGMVAYHPKFGFWTIYIDHEVHDINGLPYGVGIVYRKDFSGCDQQIALKTTTLNFDETGGSEYIDVTSKTYTTYRADSFQDWCKVEIDSSYGLTFLPNRLKVTVEPNESKEPRTANISVATVWGKNTIVSVAQSGKISD